jgi:pimeloyl-ACP methyl ester carboxylesterase
VFSIFKALLSILGMLLLSITVIADDNLTEAPAPQIIRVTATDGLTLVGDYYTPPVNVIPDSGVPAILLMHDVVTTRIDWKTLIDALLPVGYPVLSVDVRGYGDSADKAFDAEAAVADVPLWLDWLRSQPGIRPDRIVMGGAGLGAHLALVSCGNDPSCVMVFALSPGCVGGVDSLCPQIFANERGLEAVSHLTADAVSNTLQDRPILLMAKLYSDYADKSVRNLASAANSDLTLRLYKDGSRTLQNLFNDEYLKEFVVNWVNEHMPSD